MVAKGTVLINKCVAMTKNIVNSIDKFTKIVENITEFSLDTTNGTKESYEDISKKAKSLKQEVVETSTEIEDEVVGQTKVVAYDAKNLKEDTIDTAKDL